MNNLLAEFNAKLGKEDILGREMRMRIYTKLVMIMESG
jgi:hypothetical protein